MNKYLGVQSKKSLVRLMAILIISPSIYPQQKIDSPPRAKMMILGVYHFDNPNLDYVKTNVDDHLSEKRQKQISEVIELLSKFKPTKIALEAVETQRNYESYLKGEYMLKANERDQLGLRLAKYLGHKRVYAIDHKLDMDFASVMAAAQQSGDQAFLKLFQKALTELQDFERRKSNLAVREILLELNDPERIDKERNLYLQISRVRSQDRYVGADVLAGWYQRNFRIFSNLMGTVETPEDRILVIFGAGHAPVLRELVQSSPELQLIEPREYLAQR